MVDVDCVGASRILHAVGQEVRKTGLETLTRGSHASWPLCSMGYSWLAVESVHLLGVECPLDLVCHR